MSVVVSERKIYEQDHGFLLAMKMMEGKESNHLSPNKRE